MKKIRKSVLIQAPVERVFDYASNPENFPEVWPSMVEVSNIERKADGKHSFDWVYKMAGIRFHGHTDTTEVIPNQRVVTKSEKGIESVFTWTYAAEGGGTRLTVETQYTLPGTVLDKLAEPFLIRTNEREAETVLENIKSRLEMAAERTTGKQAQR
ncbi:MAG: SRPBCC family protein [Polyangiales bacterium]